MSKEKPKIVPEKIHLQAIKVFKTNLEAADDYLNNPRPVNGFEFGIAKAVSHDVENGATRFRLFFSLDALDEKSAPLGLKAEYGIEFQFRVENYSDFVRRTGEGALQVDLSLGVTLMGIAYSTARGIILEKTQGTLFGGVILPVIDPSKVLLEEKVSG
ncbi:MAG: hypothetical protein RI973_2329 [Bacteroidota bacterium]|jgi:hypothetical protein